MAGLSHDAFYTAIEQNIQQDTQACNALLQLLALERQQLKDRELDELDATINAKSQWLSQLEASAKLRSGWLQQSPLPITDKSPAEMWQGIIAGGNKPDLSEKWQALKELMQQCQDENEINGKLITRSQGTFKRLVNILRGQDENPTLYTGKGGKSEAYNKHKLGQA